jgi:predicted DNA-binding WGR domain protein
MRARARGGRLPCRRATVFGEWLLVKEWGRIGQAGTVRAEVHPDAETATEALVRQISAKRRRGYIAAGGEPDNAPVDPPAAASARRARLDRPHREKPE